MEKIYIAFINYASSPMAFLELNAHLDTVERARLDSLARESSQRAFLSGRVLARTVLGSVLGQDPKTISFRVTAGGKPICHIPTGYSFSLSHSEGLAAIAVAKTSVGLDIEAVRPNRQFADIARTVFSEKEQEAFLQRTANSIDFFYTIWTLKEAWLKLHGLGIGDIGRCPDFHFDATQKLVNIWSKNTDQGHFFSWHTQSSAGQKFILALAAPRILPMDMGPEIEILSPFSDAVAPLALQFDSDPSEVSRAQE